MLYLKDNGITAEEIAERKQKSVGNSTAQRYKSLRKLDAPKVLELWNEGKGVSLISDILNIGFERTRRILVENGISDKDIKDRGILNCKNTVSSNIKQSPLALSVMSLWNDGLAAGEIAVKLNISLTSVSNILNSYNIPKTERYCRGAQNANNYRNKPILQYDINNNFIREWPSAAEAGRQLKLDASSIRKACKGTLKTCGNFIWKNKDLTI